MSMQVAPGRQPRPPYAPGDLVSVAYKADDDALTQAIVTVATVTATSPATCPSELWWEVRAVHLPHRAHVLWIVDASGRSVRRCPEALAPDSLPWFARAE